MSEQNIFAQRIANNADSDVMLDLQLLDEAIDRKGSFAQGFTDNGILQFINRKSIAMANQISSYTHNDFLMVHYSKKNLLNKIIPELQHMASVARHNETYNQFNASVLRETLDKVNMLFNEYSRFGSVYLMRHCDKENRTSMSGVPYTGITQAAIRDQANLIAENIFREALISPKKLRVKIYFTEMPRTRIFGDIILHKLLEINHYGEDKITVTEHSFNDDIKFGHWSDACLNEALPIMKQRGEFKFFLEWLDGDDIFKTLKNPAPNPMEVTNKVVGFIKECSNGVNKNHSNGYYDITIAVSHAWIIDVAMHKLIPDFRTRVARIINTAEFCKAECGEFCFGGEWVPLK